MLGILFIKCIISGYLLAAPIGPVNLICIRHTLNRGPAAGMLVGLGAATADALYGYAAAAGLSVLTAFLLRWDLLFRWGGGLLILYLGYKTFRAEPKETDSANHPDRTPANLFAGIFLLTLTNPVTIFTFIAVFSSFGIAALVTNSGAAAIAALGVFTGSALWWLTLTRIVGRFRHKVSPHMISRVNKVVGIIIIALGAVSLLKF